MAKTKKTAEELQRERISDLYQQLAEERRRCAAIIAERPGPTADAYDAACKALQAQRVRAEAAEATIAGMREAVLEFEVRPPEHPRVFVAYKGPGEPPTALAPTQVRGFFEALDARWKSADVKRWSEEFRLSRANAETLVRERDELKKKLGESALAECLDKSEHGEVVELRAERQELKKRIGDAQVERLITMRERDEARDAAAALKASLSNASTTALDALVDVKKYRDRAEELVRERDQARDEARGSRAQVREADAAWNALIAKLKTACAGSEPSGGHDWADEAAGLLRVTRSQRDDALYQRDLLDRRLAVSIKELADAKELSARIVERHRQESQARVAKISELTEEVAGLLRVVTSLKEEQSDKGRRQLEKLYELAREVVVCACLVVPAMMRRGLPGYMKWLEQMRLAMEEFNRAERISLGLSIAKTHCNHENGAHETWCTGYCGRPLDGGKVCCATWGHDGQCLPGDPAPAAVPGPGPGVSRQRLVSEVRNLSLLRDLELALRPSALGAPGIEELKAKVDILKMERDAEMKKSSEIEEARAELQSLAKQSEGILSSPFLEATLNGAQSAFVGWLCRSIRSALGGDEFKDYPHAGHNRVLLKSRGTFCYQPKEKT